MNASQSAPVTEAVQERRAYGVYAARTPILEQRHTLQLNAHQSAPKIDTMFINRRASASLARRRRGRTGSPRAPVAKAAVVNDSKAILKSIISRKQKACSCTSSTTGAAYAASGAWRA